MQNELSERVFHSANWYKALTLSERLALPNDNQGESSAINSDLASAQRHLERWRSQLPFNKPDYFIRRLDAERITEEQLLFLLGEPAESLLERASAPPDWLDYLEEAYAEFKPSTNANSIPEGAEDDLPKRSGLIGGLEPLIKHGLHRLREVIKLLGQTYPNLPFDSELVTDLFSPNLFMQIMSKTARTLVLELNVARLKGILDGDTPRQRYESFSRLLSDPDFLIHLLEEYPVLLRQLFITIDNWVNNTTELLTRLCADWDAIKGTLLPGEPGILSEVSGGAGDSHCQGRSVALLKFASGVKLVYKPHSLSVDIHFVELLHWLNERGDHAPFRELKIIAGDGYGWVEFASAQGCESEDGVRRFYQRQGGLLALLYALEATDFHLENLIAAAEHPVMVDMEALFHPRPKKSFQALESMTAATDAINYSVMRVGLLPQRLWVADGNEGVDLSGLGGTPGQLTPSPVLTYENELTDEMHLVRKHVEMPGSFNRPKLGETDVILQNYTDEIVAGFTSIYKLLLRYRGQLLAEDGPLARFSMDEVRAVLRPTMFYEELLTESYHPDMLRDSLTRAQLLDHLWAWTEISPEIIRVCPAETTDMERGDIPFFSCRPSSRDIWTSRGERIPNFFEETSLDTVRRRLSELNEEDLTRQNWFIKASISSLSLGINQDSFVRYELEESTSKASRERLLQAARSVADRLEALALRDEKNINWLGLTLLGSNSWTLLPLAHEMYNGTLGVAIFLAYVGEIVHEERYTELASTIIKSLANRIEPMLVVDKEKRKLVMEGMGGFSGLGAVIYAMTHTGQLWGDPSSLATAESLVSLMPEMVEEDKSLDIISGSAGCIANLLSLYRCTSSERALVVARQCAERILSFALPMERGLAWDNGMGVKPLAGFSHGASGIAWALLELWTVTGEERYRSTALAALEYERTLFSPEAGNWPDLRKDMPKSPGHEEDLVYLTAWCHGAPGIGLARLSAIEHSDRPELRAELNAAINTTLRYGFGLNHSLCHGDLGNLEFLLEASLRLNDAKLSARVYKLAAAIMDSIDRQGWLCGTPACTETPGLMIGLSGIGYELLRLAEPGRVPSVLTLAAPPDVCREKPGFVLASQSA